jgi:hypothetical protein
MKIIPANSGIKALVLAPGASSVRAVDVVAWEIHDTGSMRVAPRPIVAAAVPGSRVAVNIGEHGPQCLEWPDVVHANVAAFEKSAA